MPPGLFKFFSFVLSLSCATQIIADDSIDFQRDVAPILQSRCESCHGSQEREGGLRFLSQQDLFSRNDSGEPAIVPGKPDESELLRRVSADESERMPPEGTALTDEQIATLRRWIEQGAKWPETQIAPVHWAYQAPKRPAIPKSSHLGRVENAIDAFVLSTLDDLGTGLTQSPAATPAKLLRRVSLDLTGLPPDPKLVRAFEADPSFEHYVEIVDALLSSPRYGEKWARQWLDLARYADSNGFQADQFREIWAYRDWVINAFNADMPFDQFTIEQLAGDLMSDATRSQRIATGFHRCTTCNVEAGVDPEENRTNQIIDRVNTTATVWLGTTLECAQCHNHKYDPFTQQDYYQIFAYFNNTPLEVVQPKGEGVQFEVSGPLMDLPLSEEQAAQKERLRQKVSRIEQDIQQRKLALADVRSDWQTQLKSQLDSLPQWHVLVPVAFESAHGADHEILPDHSILLSGKAPDKDQYTIRLRTRLQGITGFKLETLTDDSLPGQGPGRGDQERPNFVAHELTISARSVTQSESETPLTLHSARADFSQKNYDVAGLIDGDPKTAWAINPKFHEPHWATFLTSEPLSNDDGLELTVSLDQHYGGARTIGRLRFQAMTGTSGAESLPENVREILASTDELTEEQHLQLVAYHESTDATLSALNQQLEKLQTQIDAIKPFTTLVMTEMEESRTTNIFQRGSFLQRGAEVTPAIPTALQPANGQHPDSPHANRLDFAQWLVSTENPLVARVAVNRWWAEFFGRGIVETLEDFGTQGERPTHPELLDWLAVEFMERGWSMKQLHRLIVLSETYRQDSRATDGAYEADPYNKWYARGPRFRLSAETIRDQALAASGLISFKMGGPPIYPPQPENIWRHVGRNAPKYETDTDEDRFRRGIYVVWRRSAPYPSFVNFDAPDRGTCVVQRSRTNTPLQALTLLNDPAYVEIAHALAQRVLTELPSATDRERLDAAMLHVLARVPDSQEAEHLLAFLHAETSRLEQDSQTAEEMVPKPQRIEAMSLAQQAAWFEVANILLNLDETITRN